MAAVSVIDARVAATATDPALIARWADAWAISRGAATPVPRDGAQVVRLRKRVHDRTGVALEAGGLR
jgi:hypothetical protein